jgi:hypothetical protein
MDCHGNWFPSPWADTDIVLNQTLVTFTFLGESGLSIVHYTFSSTLIDEKYHSPWTDFTEMLLDNEDNDQTLVYYIRRDSEAIFECSEWMLTQHAAAA